MTIENHTALLNNLGQLINVCAVSSILDHSGRYILDAVIFHAGGNIELGLSDTLTTEHIGYFQLDYDVTLGG